MIWSITGPSASGKTTLVANLLATIPNAQPLTSTTTRAPRHTDNAGEYEYVSPEMFDRLSREQAFIWEVSPHGHRYGTRKAVIDEALSSERIFLPILVIEAAVKLNAYVQAKGGAVRFVYVLLEDDEELRKRFEARGDAPESAAARLAECRDWNARARQSGVPFYFLDGSQSREAMAGAALRFFRS